MCAHVVDDGTAFLQTNKDVSYELAKTLAKRLQGVTTYLADLSKYLVLQGG